MGMQDIEHIGISFSGAKHSRLGNVGLNWFRPTAGCATWVVLDQFRESAPLASMYISCPTSAELDQ